jgi:hypothetical protein
MAKLTKTEKEMVKDLEGNDVYLGDRVYMVSDNFILLHNSFAEERDSKLKVFKNKEKAQEYIDINKPKYEILSFYYNNKLFSKKDNKNYYWSDIGTWLNYDKYSKINSVKRISDGEIFTLGDTCKTDFLKEFKIEEINLEGLLHTDSSFKEYFDSGEERYDQDEMYDQELYQELVVVANAQL